MSILEAAWNTIKWKNIKKRLGYTDEELKLFRNNPRNEKIISMAKYLMKRTISNYRDKQL